MSPSQSLFTSYCKTSRMYVTLCECEFILWDTVAKDSQWHCFLFPKLTMLIPFPKGSEWCLQWLCYISIQWHYYRLWVICGKQGNYIILHECRRLAGCHAGLVDQRSYQNLSMANSMWVILQIFLMSCSTYIYCSMTTRMWVTLHILWKLVSSHPFLWLTGSEQHCTFCERQSHHIFSSDHQFVSEITHSVKGSLTTSFPMPHSKWVRHFVKGSLIISFHTMTNSKWVRLHILWMVVSSHLFLWLNSM